MNKSTTTFILVSIILQLTYIHRSHQQKLNEIVAEQIQREYNTPLLMTSCVRQLMLKYSNASQGEGAMTILTVLHQSAGAQRNLIRSLMENVDLNFMIKKSHRYHYSTHAVIEKSKMYTFLTVDASDLEGVVALLRTLPTWNALAKVLVIFPFELAEDELKVQVERSLRYLFEEVGFFDVIVIAREINTMRVVAYTFFPYDNNNCAKEVNNIEVIDECEVMVPAYLDLTDYRAVEKYINENKEKGFFTMTEHRNGSGKVPDEIPGCNITISVADFSPFAKIEKNQTVERGIEVNLIKTVAETKLNAKIKWALISPKVRYSNFTVSNETGIFANLLQR